MYLILSFKIIKSLISSAGFQKIDTGANKNAYYIRSSMGYDHDFFYFI